jgi:hypothetical protein
VKVRGVELDANDRLARRDGGGTADAGGGLGQECRDAPVEQPVGLVDALGHRHGDNRAISGHLDDRDAERGVDPCVGAGENGRIRLAARVRGRCHEARA